MSISILFCVPLLWYPLTKSENIVIINLRKITFFASLYIFSLCAQHTLSAQSFGFQLEDNKTAENISFEYVNGFLVVDILFNQSFPLKFIVDTGASHTIITKKEIISLFNLSYGRTFEVYGADLSTVLYAHLVKSVHLSTTHFEAPNQDILVLEEDYFNFHRLTGMEIHGILGADMFKHLAVKFNYKSRTISLYKPNSKRLKVNGYNEIDLSIEKSKPYIICKTTLSNDTVLDAKFLIDTGASAALLLNTKSDSSLVLPDEIIPGNLGYGLGGLMEGYIGRIPFIDFGVNTLENVICRFQEVELPDDSIKIVHRNGIIGNFILDRFIVVIDYPNERLYTKPIRKWKRKFTYDKSGINFISVGLENRTFYVNSVLHGSPADLAGIKTGDIIKKINGKSNIFLSYSIINRVLRNDAGKKVRLKIKRGKQIIKTEFRLKDLI